MNRKIFKFLFGDILSADIAIFITIVTSIIYGIFFVQENYDKAVANQTRLYDQLNSKFLMFGHINSIRIIEPNDEPEEIVFLENKSVLLKIESEGKNKILIISCDESILPK
jgi:hypothetical protein